MLFKTKNSLTTFGAEHTVCASSSRPVVLADHGGNAGGFLKESISKIWLCRWPENVKPHVSIFGHAFTLSCLRCTSLCTKSRWADERVLSGCFKPQREKKFMGILAV